jgi:hypothetical protein
MHNDDKHLPYMSICITHILLFIIENCHVVAYPEIFYARGVQYFYFLYSLIIITV